MNGIKQGINATVIFGLLLASAMNVSFGEEPATDPAMPGQTEIGQSSFLGDIRVSVGVKMWINSWEKFLPDPYAVVMYTDRSASELAPIPTVAVKYKDFFISGSYFSNTSYGFSVLQTAPTFSRSPFPINLPPGTPVHVGIDATREEWDVNLGYFLHPNLAFVVGYKNIDQTFTSTASIADSRGQLIPGLGSTVVHTKVDYSGPMLGLVGVFPLGHGFGLYGNFAYGFLTADFHGYAGANSKSAQYILADGGLSWTYRFDDSLAELPLASASIFGGYRYQSIEVSNAIPGKTGSDYTKGFVVGLNLTF